MEKNAKRVKRTAGEGEIADKLVKVKGKTHRLLKIKAAKAGKTMGGLLDSFAEGDE